MRQVRWVGRAGRKVRIRTSGAHLLHHLFVRLGPVDAISDANQAQHLVSADEQLQRVQKNLFEGGPDELEGPLCPLLQAQRGFD